MKNLNKFLVIFTYIFLITTLILGIYLYLRINRPPPNQNYVIISLRENFEIPDCSDFGIENLDFLIAYLYFAVKYEGIDLPKEDLENLIDEAIQKKEKAVNLFKLKESKKYELIKELTNLIENIQNKTLIKILKKGSDYE